MVCQSPWQVEGRNSLGKNYCIGCIGTKYLSTTRYNKIGDYLNDRPNGEWYPDPGEHGTNTEHVISGTYYGATANGLSLYQAQLDQRKATGQRVIPAEWYN